METITKILEQVDSVMYYPILIIVMALAGIYFTVLTKGVQVRLFPESIRLLLEPPEDKAQVSSLQAMLVSTASRVGTGNIVGVSTAICIGQGVAPGKAGACSGALGLYRHAEGLQKKQGIKPVFKAAEIGLNEEELDFWK